MACSHKWLRAINIYMNRELLIGPPKIKINSSSFYIPVIPKALSIVRDTREIPGGLAYTFANKVPLIDKALSFGDYSILGMEQNISIERKSLSDFFSSIGGRKKKDVKNTNRQRLKNEFERMKVAEFRALVIEGSEIEVMSPELGFSNMNPNSVYSTIISFEIKHGIHVYYGTRKNCQIKILNWFTTFYNYKVKQLNDLLSKS
jgi:ERCC4-type nuclease